jgi:hypothetical protein
MDAKMFEEHLEAKHLAALLAEGEADIEAGRVRPMRAFLREMKHGKIVSR